MSLATSYLKNFSQIFLYHSEKGFLGKLHPLPKTILMVVSISIAIKASRVETITITLTILTLLALTSISWRKVVALLSSITLFILPMVLFMYLYMLLQKPTVDSAIRTASSIAMAIARLMIMTISFYILFITTKPQSIVRILSRFGISYRYSYGFILALRLLSVIAEDLAEIISVQKLRGLTFKNNLLKRLRSYIAVFIPLTISTLTRIDEITISLEVKGFGLRSSRTYLYKEKLGLGDAVFISLCLVVMIIAIYFDI